MNTYVQIICEDERIKHKIDLFKMHMSQVTHVSMYNEQCNIMKLMKGTCNRLNIVKVLS